MTVNNIDRDAIAHGKITEKPLRDRPKHPTWVLKLSMAVTGLLFAAFVVFHMVGNLKVFLPAYEDGSRPINVYGKWLREMFYPLLPHEAMLWIFRIVLLAPSFCISMVHSYLPGGPANLVANSVAPTLLVE